MKRYLIPLLLFLTFALSAQDIDTDTLLQGLDDDSLFGQSEDDAVETASSDPVLPEEGEAAENPFQWGGKIYSDLGSSLIWNDLSDSHFETSFDPRFGIDLFFDARPSADFRVFAKGKAFYPFDGSADNAFAVQELFSDFNLNNKIYFRVGKQTVNWGVGYLYRPTDILNLSPLDPANRDADREGPLAVKTQIPFGVDTVYFYAVADKIEHPEDITYAVKGEFLAGNWELGVGTILNPKLTPKGALFVTGPLGPLDFFAESLIQYGSDLDFYSQVSPVPTTFGKKDQAVISATAGLMFYNSGSRITVIGQYWFNGEAQSADDWSRVGHHFAGATVEKGIILQPQKENSSILNLSILWLGDFTDMSGMVSPEVEWEFVKHAALALGGTWYYGDELSYYRYRGTGSAAAPLEVKLSLRLGYGNF